MASKFLVGAGSQGNQKHFDSSCGQPTKLAVMGKHNSRKNVGTQTLSPPRRAGGSPLPVLIFQCWQLLPLCGL